MLKCRYHDHDDQENQKDNTSDDQFHLLVLLPCFLKFRSALHTKPETSLFIPVVKHQGSAVFWTVELPAAVHDFSFRDASLFSVVWAKEAFRIFFFFVAVQVIPLGIALRWLRVSVACCVAE